MNYKIEEQEDGYFLVSKWHNGALVNENVFGLRYDFTDAADCVLQTLISQFEMEYNAEVEGKHSLYVRKR